MMGERALGCQISGEGDPGDAFTRLVRAGSWCWCSDRRCAASWTEDFAVELVKSFVSGGNG